VRVPAISPFIRDSSSMSSRTPPDSPPPPEPSLLVSALLRHRAPFVLIYDRKGYVRWASSALLDILQCSAGDVTGQRAAQFLAAPAQAALVSTLAGQTTFTVGPLCTSQTGDEHHLRCLWLPLTDAHGALNGGAVIARPVDERAPAEQGLATGPACREEGEPQGLATGPAGRGEGEPPNCGSAHDHAQGHAEAFGSLCSATSDPLHPGQLDDGTELPGQAVYVAYTDQLAARGDTEGVLVCLGTIEGLDSIRHHFGEAALRHVLRETAARLRELVREGDLVAYCGHETFAAVMPGVKDRKQADLLVARLRGALGRPYRLGKTELLLTTSCGCALSATAFSNAEHIRSSARLALQAARSEGGDTCRFYEAGLSADFLADSPVLQAALERAITSDQLVLYYQPIVRLANEKLVGVEALVRWQHPDEGLLVPARFLPVAERSRLIERVGDEVRKLAVVFAGRRPPLRVSVNIAAREAARFELCAELTTLVRKARLSPRRFELELTETALLREPERARTTMECLRQNGFSLALDDFGTGYSSLTHLRELPIDRVKLDRSFVSNLPAGSTDKKIVRAVIDLAHSLALEVVAEGVETQAQASLLRELGCDLAQGYLYAPPLSEDELERWMEGHERATGR